MPLANLSNSLALLFCFRCSKRLHPSHDPTLALKELPRQSLHQKTKEAKSEYLSQINISHFRRPT